MARSRPRVISNPGTYSVLLTLLILLGLPASTLAQDFMVTGSYTGDGSSNHSITGIGFQPDLVIVKDDTGSEAHIRTANMPAGSAKAMASAKSLVYDPILSLDADGFTLGNSNETNQLGITYYWTAMKTGTGTMELGQYIGNGSGFRNITLGLEPQFVMLIPADNNKTVFHTQDMPSDVSYPFDSTGEINGAVNYFFSFFMILGDDPSVNKDGTTYYYVAWHAGNGVMDQGSYLGDGTENRDLFNPLTDHQYVIIQSAEPQPTVQRTMSLTGDATLEFRARPQAMNRIQQLWSNGFQLGTDITVNKGGWTYYIISFGNPSQQSDLSIAATVDNPNPHQGNTINLGVGIGNLGPNDGTGVVVSDLLPTGLTFVSATSSVGSYNSSIGTWTIGDLDNGDTETLILTVTVDAGTAGNTITNSPAISFLDQADWDTSNNTDTVDINVLNAPQADLVVNKTVDQSLPHEGDTITYTVTVTNDGPDDATGIEITDQLPAGLSLSSVIEGQGTYNSGSGIWSVGNLASGVSTTLTLLASVNAGTTGNTLTNTAAVTTTGTNDPDSSNDTASVDLTVAGIPLADLEVAMTLSETSPQEGDLVVFGVTVTNNGPDTATNINVDDALPSGLSLAGAGISQGSYDAGTGIWALGTLTSSGTATLNLSVTVDAGTLGNTITNQATASSVDVTDPVTSNNEAAQTLTVTGSDLTLAMTLDNNTPGEGTDILYLLTLANEGPHPTSGVQVTDLLPAGLTMKSANLTQGSYDAGTGIWDAGSLSNGQTIYLSLVATTDLGTTGQTITNTASITAVDQVDPDLSNNTDAQSLTVLSVDLALTMTLDNPTPGEGSEVHYGISVVNNGPQAATAVQITDLIPAGLTFSSATASQGTYDAGSGVWNLGDLGVGVTVDLDLAATTDIGTTGLTFINTASITALDQSDSDSSNDSDTAQLTVAAMDLQLAATVDNPTPLAGDVVSFTITLTNLASIDATTITVHNQLPEGITLLQATASLGSYDTADSTWAIASLASAGTADLVLQARVDAIAASEPLSQTATITSVDQPDIQADNNAATAVIIITGIDLEVNKTVDVTTPSEGDPVTYTLTIANIGSGDATGVQMTDILPGGVVFNSALASQGDYSQTTGIWDIGSLSAASQATLAIECTVDTGAGGTKVTNFTAVTASDQPDAVTGNNSDTVSFYVTAGLLRGTVQIWSTPDEPTLMYPGTSTQASVLDLTLTNQGANDDAVTALVLTNLTEGSGTQTQLDDQWQELSLSYQLRGSPTQIGSVRTGTFANGLLTFSNLGWAVASGDTIDILVKGAPSLRAVDRTRLKMGLAGPDAVTLSQNISSPGPWPLSGGSAIDVDGFVASQATVIPVSATLFPVGSQNNLALAVDLPGNGYLADTLYGLGVVNKGTAQPLDDISRMRAWADLGDGDFNPQDDLLLGSLAFSGEMWQITGLATEIPPEGRRVFITVDIAETAQPSHEIRLGLPAGAGTAVEMYSDNDGPLDLPLENPQTQGISVTDRIILTADYVPSGVVRPDAGDVTLLQFILSNTYDDSRSLQSLTVTNTSTGPGDTARLDGLCRQLALRKDGNDNGLLDDLDTDPQLATATFSTGRLTFTGLDLTIPTSQRIRLFVTADIDPQRTADNDRLGAQISGTVDVGMPGATIVGTWPLNSGAEWTIDGMVAAQVATGPTTTLTLGPDDGPIPALDLTIPGNGGLGDELQGISFVNLGTAGPSDIAQADLWADGGNGIFDGDQGDDTLLAPLTLAGDSWSSNILSTPVPPAGLRLFATLTVTPSPSDSVTVRLSVPIGGIVMDSSNDGPLDSQVNATGTLIISTSPLRSSISFQNSATNVGQTGTVTMVVTNAGGETVTGITPFLEFSGGDGNLSLQNPVPTTLASLDPGQSASVAWDYTGTAAGTVILVGNAQGTISGSQIRRSIQTPTTEHLIHNPVDFLELFPTVNLPFSINRGQDGLVPLTLTFVNPGDELTADAQLTSLRLRFMETASGPEIAPADLIERLTISEGTEIYLDRTDLPTTGPDVNLILDRPVHITNREPVTLGVKLDLNLNSTVPSFRMSIEEAGWVAGSDAVDGRTIPVQLNTAAFPIETGQATMVSPASDLNVAVGEDPSPWATPGQAAVPLMKVLMTNTSQESGSSTIEVGQVAFVLRDGSGTAISHPDSLLEWVNLQGAFLQYFSGPVVTASDSLLILSLSPPVTVPGGGTLELLLEADLRNSVPLGSLVPVLAGANFIDARDGNMNNPVPVVITTSAIGAPVTILAPATQIAVSGSGLAPRTIAQGARTVSVLAVTLTNPHPTGNAPVICDGLTLRFLDGNHEPLDPNTYLDRIRLRNGSLDLATIIEPDAADGLVSMSFSPLTLNPESEGEDLEILLDFKPDAPGQNMELVLDSDGFLASDAVTGKPVNASAVGGGVLYLSSGLMNIVMPADELMVSFEGLMPPLLAPGPDFYPIMSLDLDNPAQVGQGAVDLLSLTLEQSPTGAKSALSLGSCLATMRVTQGDSLLGLTEEIPLDSSRATVQFTQPLTLVSGQLHRVTIAVTVREGVPSGTLQLAVAAAGIGAYQAGSQGSPVHITPAEGTSFPFLTKIGNLSTPDFAASFANFPNPFAAGREATTFTYVLPAEARVSLRLLTPHGEIVTVLMQDEPRSAGLHQSDTWPGFNSNGTPVHNGVYLAELRVVYDDGSSARALYKVGVVR